jgi:APA family basic amino acid/polyamine antiporter
MDWRIKPIGDSVPLENGSTLPRVLGTFHLTLLGVGSIIGTGIFVLTAVAAQLAGPAMMVSLVIGGVVSAAIALCYSELVCLVPAAGSSYNYAYVAFGEVVAWLVGWALILEYSISASAVAVGWSNYFVGFLYRTTDLRLPQWLAKGYFAGGGIDAPAVAVTLAMTCLLVRGTREGATLNAVLVAIKFAALLLFIALAIPEIRGQNFHPFAPAGLAGIGSAAATIYFVYLGFDTVSTAAEESHNPQRTVPIATIGSLVICTVLYVVVAYAAIGSAGGQPVLGPNGLPASPASAVFLTACQADPAQQMLACSVEPLAFALQKIGHSWVAGCMGLAAFVALPSVVLLSIFGQTRIGFSMARDGLLPAVLGRLHTRYETPYAITLVTGAVIAVATGLFPVAALADLANSGTLFCFLVVALGVMFLRVRAPSRPRRFRVPALSIVGPIAVLGCVYLFVNLSIHTQIVFWSWTVLGAVLYACFGYRKSRIAKHIAAIRP